MAAIAIPKDVTLVAIVGQTGSGKSDLAMELAAKYGGEIVAADSRTVYKGLDIGTAKPSAEDQRRVPHHLLDVVRPDQSFNAADFKRLAQQAIKDINSRGKLAILVGGTGLYVDAVLYDFNFGPAADPRERQRLQKLSTVELRAIIRQKGLKTPKNDQNPRHLIRSIEINDHKSQKQALRARTLVLGVQRDPKTLKQRLTARVEVMVEAGLVQEAERLAKRYGWEIEALRTPGYKAIRQYLEGLITLDQAKAEFVQADLRLAKRQRVWFKRNADIHWL